ncbi:hypothetical protein EB796_003216 [Bugula neritina]|uniref:Protein sleepless n=1 Tax=Bugula neritina TaxID=10212 RepID=A0A7J7KIG9_BUGNE|nr:hypothetical protein EB796_003216 [Bugula neritina]
MKYQILLAVFSLGCLVTPTLSTQCYVCDSVSDSTCADAYTGHFTHINTCDDGAMGCSKTKIQGTALGVKVVVAIRTCDEVYPNNDACQKPVKFAGQSNGVNVKNGKVHTCSCTGNLCNGAPAYAKHSVVAIAVLSLASSILRKLVVGC